MKLNVANIVTSILVICFISGLFYYGPAGEVSRVAEKETSLFCTQLEKLDAVMPNNVHQIKHPKPSTPAVPSFVYLPIHDVELHRILFNQYFARISTLLFVESFINIRNYSCLFPFHFFI